VIIELLRRHISEHHDDSTQLDELPPVLRLAVTNLATLNKYISVQSYSQLTPSLDTQWGKIVPLGFERLKIIELIAALFTTNCHCIDQALMQINALGNCLDLFFLYPFNNFLHATVEAVVQGILEGENEDLKLSLLKDAKLIDHICRAAIVNDEEVAKPKGVRLGHMGHVTSISTSIINIASITPSIEKYLSEHEGWGQYVKGSLQSTKERESRSLGGYLPLDFTVDEGNEDFDYEEDNGELVFESNSFENREDYSTHQGSHEFRLEPDDDDEEESVVIQGRVENVDDDDEDASQGWVTKQISDEEASTSTEENISNHVQSLQL